MKRFCTKWNETIELKDISGRLTCVTHGQEDKCTEARCKYAVVWSATFTLRDNLFGDADRVYSFSDYTIELKEVPPPGVAESKGESRICDVCSRPTYLQDAYLLHTDVVLSSDAYFDFIIRRWVNKAEIRGQVLQYNKISKSNSFQYVCQCRYAISAT